MPEGDRPAYSRRRLQTLLAALAVATAAWLVPATAWADPPGRVGRIAQTSGAVWLFDDEQAEWVAAQRNRPLTSGDRLSAERDARVELQVGSATLHLDGSSEIEFSALDDDRVRIHLHHGSLALRLRNHDAAREFAITTAEGRFEPLSVGRFRIDSRDSGPAVGSLGGVPDGRLRFEARDSALEINAGQRAEFWLDRGVTHYAWAGPAGDRFAEWLAEQDRQDYREPPREAARRAVSPEMTGAGELDRYGDWDRHPEYGALWWPRGVAVGWAPYRHGHWAHVRPWGWTWVDDAPWGFAPFHYGRWVWWRDRWGWAPGQYVARPVYAPALVAWIGGPNLSVGINLGGPAVGWVALSPREVYRPHYNVTNIYVTNINNPHRRWQPPVKPNQPIRTEPIMYTNQGVPGGVTVVSQQVLRERQSISNAVIAPVDARTVQRWQAQAVVAPQLVRNEAPPAPAAPRIISTAPGMAAPVTPAAPGAVRATHWGQVAPARSAPAQAVQGNRGEDRGQGQRNRTREADAQPGRPVPKADHVVSTAPPQRAAPAQGEPVQPALPVVVVRPQGSKEAEPRNERAAQPSERRRRDQQQNQ